MSYNKLLIKQHQYNPEFLNLLLIHGWGFNSQIWERNLSYLQSRYNVYTLDLNGHGANSYNKQYENLDIYIETIINHLNKITPESNPGFSILGWSLGGIIALCLQKKYPQLFNKSILCCSNPCFLSKPDWENGVEQSIWDKFQFNLLNNQNQTIKEFLLLQTLSHKNSKELYKDLLDIYNNSSPATLEGLKWGLDLLNKDYRDYLNQIDMNKISFIFGAKDRLVNQSLSDWINKLYPKINTLILNNSGHMPFITEPDLFYQFIFNELNKK